MVIIHSPCGICFYPYLKTHANVLLNSILKCHRLIEWDASVRNSCLGTARDSHVELAGKGWSSVRWWIGNS